MTAHIPLADLPPLCPVEPPLDDLLDRLPGRPAAEALRGRMTRPRADALCLEAYGRTFAEERAHRQALDNKTKAKNRSWRGLGAAYRSGRRSLSDDAGPGTARLNAR